MIRTLFIACIALVPLMLADPAAAAGDADAGKALSKKCSGCHGADGKGKKDNPPIAGMSVESHIKAMQDYKAGARKHAMMERLAKKMSDQEVADVAAYYAALE